MSEQDPIDETRQRKLRADLALKRGDLNVATTRWVSALDAGRVRQAARWSAEVETIKRGIADAKRALAALEGT